LPGRESPQHNALTLLTAIILSDNRGAGWASLAGLGAARPTALLRHTSMTRSFRAGLPCKDTVSTMVSTDVSTTCHQLVGLIFMVPGELEDAMSQRPAVALGPQSRLAPGLAASAARQLLEDTLAIAQQSPFRHQVTPGGFQMSVAATNCGGAGWVSDRRGYRYDSVDPVTGQPWPAMPHSYQEMAVNAAQHAGFEAFEPDACLINRFTRGARLSLHQDRSERDMRHPVVTVSLGLPAMFLWGGARRSDKPRAVPLTHGDVVVFGGVDRLRFHGVKELPEGHHPLAGSNRYSLTFRSAL
jgi:DNA oxidative demethylase